MIDLELTPKIKQWLDTEPSRRNLREGAELLLAVNRNRIMFANITRNLPRHASTIEYHLQKIYNQRVAGITHRQVQDMMQKVDAIAGARGLALPEGSSAKTDFQRGRRADHDELPPEIQQLYVDNADIMRRMRECHVRLRMITPDTSTCPDNDRYPWAKEILALDTLYRDNWNKYDHYIKGTAPADVQPVKDPRSTSRDAARICNLLLGKYVKAPNKALASRIREAYARIVSPTENLRSKMLRAGLLE